MRASRQKTATTLKIGLALGGTLTALLANATALWGAPISISNLSVDSFRLQISEDISNYADLTPALQSSLRLVAQDRPNFTITNTSTTSSITAFYMTMGNSAFSFGSLLLSPQAGEPTLDTYLPGAGPGLHANSNFVSMTFSDFAPSLSYDFRVNIDRVIDGGASLTNYRQALASGTDPSQWAMVNVAFSDGTSLHELITPSQISGASADAVYSYFYCPPSAPPIAQIMVSAQATPVVPEPATGLLAILGAICAGLVVVRRRRRS